MEKSVFEILDFMADREKAENTPEGVVLNYENAEPSIASILRQVITSLNQNGEVGLHRVAIFSAYFGIPKDEEKRQLWGSLSFSEKVANIRNKLATTGSISFTKIL